MPEFDEDSCRRISNTVRTVEELTRTNSTHILRTSSTPRNPIRGILLNPLSSRTATLLQMHYNPAMSVYMVAQVGLWGLAGLPLWTLTIQTSAGSVQGQFTNPTSQELTDFFYPSIGATVFGGNPVQRSVPGITTTSGKVDHHFWLITVPDPKATFTFSSQRSETFSDRALIGRRLNDSPTGVLLPVFDALNLDFTLNAGSSVVCLPFSDGYGVVSATPSMYLG